jgi:flavin reductase (DIM6/NTAB) family NADH-FMN oxidoreductase RutF
MDFLFADLNHHDRYKLLIGTVQPRPIAWVSTLSTDGVPNLAPFSFFTVVCSEPPTIVFCPSVRTSTANGKDTLHNVRDTGEFVINIVSEAVAEQMNITSTDLPPDVDEFALAGVTPLVSQLVKPPRVAESPVSMECKLTQIVTISDNVGGGSLVIGEVLMMHVADEVYIPDFKVDTFKMQPIGRLSGAGYSRTRDIFEMPRPKPQI